VKIREVAEETADETDVELLTAAGKSDVDNASQVAALEDMTKRGAKGILIVPANSRAIVPAIEKARRAGVTVVALETPTQPASAVEALFATNNRRAGNLIGRYAKAKAEEQGIEPKIAMLDLAPGISVGELRHDGFLEGFGIEDGDPKIVGSVNTEGNEEKARAGMAQLLEEKPGDQRRLHHQRAGGLRGRRRPGGGRQERGRCDPRLNRRRLRRDQGRGQAGHDRRHLAAISGEHGHRGDGGRNRGAARRSVSVRLP
jgi:Periplasmic binding protein domain